MMHTARRLAICLLLVSMAAISVRGQSSLVGGPALGFSTNADGSIVWPIIGIPGASLLGSRLAFGVGISAAEVSSQHDYLVAIRTEDGQPVISRLASGAIVPSPIAGTRPGPTVFAISPTGGALGVFNQDARILQVLRGFPSAPEMAFEFDASNIAGRVTAMAVSDDASLALLGISRDGIDSLWIVSGASAGFVAPNAASSITFFANRHDAAFADRASGLAYLLPNVTNTSSPILLLNRNEGVEGLTGIGVSDDGRFTVIAGATSGSVGIVDMGTAAHTIVRCNCKPSGVHRMTGNALFRLNDPPDAMTTLLDLSSGKPRIVIVPAEPKSITPGRETAR